MFSHAKVERNVILMLVLILITISILLLFVVELLRRRSERLRGMSPS